MRKNVLLFLAMVAMISFSAKMFADAPDVTPEPTATAYKISGTLAIDGVGSEAEWGASTEYSSDGHNLDGTTANMTAEDNSFKFKALWDDNKIYVLVTVTDDVVLKRYEETWAAESEVWRMDNVELFFNPTGARQEDGSDDYTSTGASQWRVVVGTEDGDAGPSAGRDGKVTFQDTLAFDVSYGYAIDYPGTGYVLEMWITWAAVLPEGVEMPSAWGFTVNVGDADDATAMRKGISLWAGKGLADNQWLSVNYFGLLTLDPTIVTSIQNDAVSTFKVYPNPATNILNVSGANEVSIYNITGQLVKSASVVNGSVDVANLVSGVYVVKSGVETRTVVIK